ncbi:MAG: hypothetical protein JO189_27495 [Deltaproteobacteria bacterium]|nr:hypothetical protein [Deltaproteobacteria bacterium]
MTLKPQSLRAHVARKIVERLKLGPYCDRLLLGAVPRPWYGHCVFHATWLARKLGYPAISIIEFGVAGGNGLLCLEQHAGEIEPAFGISIHIYGFDTGHGLTAPCDFRDLPYAWKAGDYPMDQGTLRQRLRRAQLIIGDVRQTIEEFYECYKPPPVGAVIFDLDLYSSTKSALTVLAAPVDRLLPRVFCYFDDIIGYPLQTYNDRTGERLAIAEFNGQSENRYLAVSNMFRGYLPEYWHQQIYVCHLFDHPEYTTNVVPEQMTLSLR